MSKQHFDTLCVHAGIEPDPTTGAIVPPIYQSTTFVLEEVGKDRGFDYTRSSNPTRQVLETQLAALEGMNYARCYASGMSAVDAIFRYFRPGDHIVTSDDVYGGVIRLFDQILVHYGLEFTYVEQGDLNAIEAAIKPNTKMIWTEVPSNPLIKIADLEAIGKLAKDKGLLFGCDSTFATPVHLRPSGFGADIVMHSTTKYLSGHNQIIGGAVIVDREDLHEHLAFVQRAVGAVPSPFDCWLNLTGLKTLSLRMERHSANGQKVAEYLEGHSKVSRVIYPGLESHPLHDVAKRIMTGGYSGMLSFELSGGIPAGRTLMNSVELCALAESLGAVETMITHPATMTHVAVPAEERHARGLTDGLVRVSVGIENIDDILADLEQALSKVDG